MKQGQIFHACAAYLHGCKTNLVLPVLPVSIEPAAFAFSSRLKIVTLPMVGYCHVFLVFQSLQKIIITGRLPCVH
jgi:energy-converting hydrogenase Eha subunit E